MRILGFSKKWGKLQQPEFTTFRFERKDKDWGVNEVVQIVYKPRSKEREVLGMAKIVGRKSKHIPVDVAEQEAIEDGFPNCFQMWLWFRETYGRRKMYQPMNKLTLVWVNKND